MGTTLNEYVPSLRRTSGYSRIAIDEWPSDRETIFPLQAAAGYAIMQGLFEHRKNILVEGNIRLFLLAQLKLNMPCKEFRISCLMTSISFHVVERGLLGL